jgi:predicted exporter
VTSARRGILALWLVTVLASVAIIWRTPFSTDMSAFLPRSPSAAQQVLVDQLREGVVSRLILIAIEGVPQEKLASLSRELAKRLRDGDDTFGIVANGEEAGLAKDREFLWRYRYLLSPGVTPDSFTAVGLHQAFEHDVQLLGSELGVVVKRTLPADPTGETLRLVDEFAGQAHPATQDGVWFSRDGNRVLLMAQTLAAGFDIDAQGQAVARIEAAFDGARQAVPEAAGARLIESGPPVFAVRARARMQGDAERFSTIATVLVAGILFLAYRSPRILILALLPVLTGAVAGIAGVSLAFGFVHGITLGFGVTLIGEAVDYAIYLFTQTPAGGAPEATMPRIWPTLRLGMLTSVCGFSAMLLSSFSGFAQLGLFTIVGLVTALAVTRWVLPILLPRGFAARSATLFAVPLLRVMRRQRIPRLLILGLALAAGVVLATHRGAYWEDELSSMSPLSSGEKSLDEQLRRDIAAPDVRYLLVIEAADEQQALVASERVSAQLAPLVSDGLLAGFDAAGRWLPSRATQLDRQSDLPEANTLKANLEAAVAGTSFRAETFAPFLADVAAARQATPVDRKALDGTSIALRLDSLLMPGKAGWLAMVPLRGVADPPRLAAEVARFGEPHLIFLDLKGESDRLLSTYLHEALTLALAGSLAILALLAIALRSPRRVARVVAPLAAAVVCTAAFLLLAQGRLSIFNLFGLLLVVAVGSNYCLFFERQVGLEDIEERIVASLVLADLCTVIGFGILSFSGIPVLHGIGGTVAVGAFLSLVFGAVLSFRGAAFTTSGRRLG